MTEKISMDLKGAVFGGYDRECVLLCIRKILEQHKEECTQLQLQQDKAQTVSLTLEEQNRRLYEQYKQMCETLEGQSKSIEALAAQARQQKLELDAYRAKEALLENAETEARGMLAKAEKESAELLVKTRLEQENISKEAVQVRSQQIYDAELRLAELRGMAKQLNELLDRTQYVERKTG